MGFECVCITDSDGPRSEYTFQLDFEQRTNGPTKMSGIDKKINDIEAQKCRKYREKILLKDISNICYSTQNNLRI